MNFYSICCVIKNIFVSVIDFLNCVTKNSTVCDCILESQARGSAEIFPGRKYRNIAGSYRYPITQPLVWCFRRCFRTLLYAVTCLFRLHMYRDKACRILLLSQRERYTLYARESLSYQTDTWTAHMPETTRFFLA